MEKVADSASYSQKIFSKKRGPKTTYEKNLKNEEDMKNKDLNNEDNLKNDEDLRSFEKCSGKKPETRLTRLQSKVFSLESLWLWTLKKVCVVVGGGWWWSKVILVLSFGLSQAEQ